MKTVQIEIGPVSHKIHYTSLESFIAELPDHITFNLNSWLRTLEEWQLSWIEKDLLGSSCFADDKSAKRIPQELVETAVLIYIAERDFVPKRDEPLMCVNDLLVGLAVAACTERLKRAGWLTITGRTDILLKEKRPYLVTQRGYNEGIWTSEPLILWLLGAKLNLH